MQPTASPLPRPLAAAAGVAAAGVALGVSELVVGARGAGPSLVTAVGTEFIDRYAASLKELAVSLFGRDDKTALVVGIVLTALVLGGVLGVASLRRRWVGVAGLAAFGLLGWWTYQRSPLGDGLTGGLAASVAVGAGVATLLGLLHLGERLLTAGPAAPAPVVVDGVAGPDGVLVAPRGTMGPGGAPRRTFLGSTVLVAVGAVGAGALGRRWHATGSTERIRQAVVLPPVAAAEAPVLPTAPPFALDGVSPYITPNADFYRIDTALGVPVVDPAGWRLRISGLVDAPFELTYAELLALPSVQEVVTLQCVSNEVGGTLVGNATWQGVPLAALLERAGVQAGAGQVVGRSVDRFSAGFPLEAARDGRTALVAYAMNGEPLPSEHGFPARLVVAGLYGYVSATKWLQEIELATWEGVDGYWITRGWSKEGPIKPMSRIDVPRGGATLVAGTNAVAGVAWAPVGGVSAVEVRVDDGAWQPAALAEATSGATWVQWHLAWDAAPGRHRISVRALDATGTPQTGDVAPPAPDGATGWHTRTVEVQARP